MLEYLNDGLIVHVKIYYTLCRGKRVYVEEIPEDSDETYFEFEGHMYCPPFLQPRTWERYGYTPGDVETTFEKAVMAHVWQVTHLMMTGPSEPESSSGGVKPTYQSLFSFSFTSRRTVFDQFVDANRGRLSSGPSVLCKERPDHVPLLPKIMVPKSVFLGMKGMVPTREPSFCWRVEYPALLDVKDIQMVPVSYDATNKLVYMVRTVLESVYESMAVKPKQCFVSYRPRIKIGDDMYVLTEEACFIHCEEIVPQDTMCKKRRGELQKNARHSKKVRS